MTTMPSSPPFGSRVLRSSSCLRSEFPYTNSNSFTHARSGPGSVVYNRCMLNGASHAALRPFRGCETAENIFILPFNEPILSADITRRSSEFSIKIFGVSATLRIPRRDLPSNRLRGIGTETMTLGLRRWCEFSGQTTFDCLPLSDDIVTKALDNAGLKIISFRHLRNQSHIYGDRFESAFVIVAQRVLPIPN